MRRSTRMCLTAAAVGALSVGIVAGVPAQAAEHLGGNVACGLLDQSQSITGQVGDTVRLMTVTDCMSVTSSAPGVISWVIEGEQDVDPAEIPGMSFVVVTMLELGETTFAMLGQGDLGKVFTLTVAPPAGAGGGTPLTVPVQQFAVAPGTDAAQCAELAPAWTDWEALGSLRHDGWSVSWAQWPHDGAGGTVCTRQPAFSGSAWTVK